MLYILLLIVVKGGQAPLTHGLKRNCFSLFHQTTTCYASSRLISSTFLLPPPLPKLPSELKQKVQSEKQTTSPPFGPFLLKQKKEAQPPPQKKTRPTPLPSIEATLSTASKIPAAPTPYLELLTKPLHGKYIVLDTESTGLNRKEERSKDEVDKLTEIGCVEIIDGQISGKWFRRYINPERDVTSGAHRITGHTWNFLKRFPTFSIIAPEFLSFIDGANGLVIHDAPNDLRLINTALATYNNSYGKLEDWHHIIDTLRLAQYLHPKEKNNLTALCKRYNIDAEEKRIKHGALKDAELLAKAFCAIKRKHDTEQNQSNSVFQKL